MPSTALWGSSDEPWVDAKGCACNFMVVTVPRNLTVRSRRPSISRICRPLRPSLLL